MGNLVNSLATEWSKAHPERREEIHEIWSDLARMLDGLVEMNSHIITAESPPTMPAIAALPPHSGPRSGSVTRSGHRGTGPTSDPTTGPQSGEFF
jgi:hypothetical protein